MWQGFLYLDGTPSLFLKHPQREEYPRNTEMTVLRRFRIPARGTTFAGLEITEPLIFDETNGGPVPLALPCEVSLSPGPGVFGSEAQACGARATQVV